MTAPETLPIVAIVGRPNVGKSTLFNRYTGRRRALVEDQPGVTRDRIAEEVEVGERRVLLVDTAGLDPEAEAGLPAAVQAPGLAPPSQTPTRSCSWWTARRGCCPTTRSWRAPCGVRTSKPMSLAVNKIDHPEARRPRAAEFLGLGFDRTARGDGRARHRSLGRPRVARRCAARGAGHARRRRARKTASASPSWGDRTWARAPW